MTRYVMLTLVLLTGCIELPDFPRGSLIAGPRVLALVAEPPEVTPGQGLTLTPLVVEAGDYSVEYQACGAFDPLFGGQQFGETNDDDCSADNLLPPLTGARLDVPGVALQGLFDNAELASSILGGQLSPEVVEQVRRNVGLPLLVQANITTGDRVLKAVKRVLLSENSAPHHNPPPPEFKFGTIDVGPDGSNPWRCAARDGTSLTARPGLDTEIAPATVDGEESWVEPYKIINVRGEVQERMERAFYSWFGTGGEFDRGTTRAPLRNQIWTAPKEPGCYRLWLVVRDGHGGSSACGFDVGVGDPANWPEGRRCESP
jgi:hypothetical protein